MKDIAAYATRQELLRLKKKAKTAKAGHKLLKDKRESLMREFLSRVARLKERRAHLQDRLPRYFSLFFTGQALMGPEVVTMLLASVPSARIRQEERNMMGVRGLSYELENKEDVLSWELPREAASREIEDATAEAEHILAELLEYASLEQQLRRLAEEIERTRRRVNALEHVVIPQIIRAQRKIAQKLEEAERLSRAVLMKLKSHLQKDVLG